MFDSQRTAVQAEVIVFGVPHDLVGILLQIDRPGPVGIPQYLFRLLAGTPYCSTIRFRRVCLSA